MLLESYNIYPAKLVKGTFQTLVGNVKVNQAPNEIRKVLHDPSRIEKDGLEYKFVRISQGEQKIATLRKSYFSKTLQLIDYRVEPFQYDRRPKEILQKAFGINLGKMKLKPKEPKLPDETKIKNPYEVGKERPGHKYIERKLNPKYPHESDSKYIYLYEINGKRVWKDKSGNEYQEESKQEEKAENIFDKIETGKKIRIGKDTFKVQDKSDNFLIIERETDNKKIMINKNNYLSRLETESNYRKGGRYEQGNIKGTITELTDNFILVKKDEGGFKIVARYRPIELVDEEEESKVEIDDERERKRKELREKVAYDVDDYDIEGLMSAYDYKNQEEYQAFMQTTNEAGFGKKNDLQFEKFVKAGNTIHKITRTYNPALREVEIAFDNVIDYKIKYEGETYTVRDLIDDDGKTYFVVQDKEGDLLKIDYADYEKYTERIVTDQFGGTYVKDMNIKPIKISGELSEEARARIEQEKQQLKNRFVVNRKLSKKQKQALTSEQINAINEEIKNNLKELLQSQEYVKGAEKLKAKGYEDTENAFIKKKKITIDNYYKFEFVATFNKATKEFEEKLNDATVKQVEINNVKYDIVDVTEKDGEQFITYRKPADQEGEGFGVISVSTLKELNGDKIFEKSGKTKGVISTTEPKLVYFTPREKELAVWEVVDIKDLAISHNLDFTPNPNYRIKGMQNRDRATADSKQQIEEIKQNIKQNFDIFMPNFSGSSSEGSSVVTDDYQVIGGNGRALAIAQLYEGGDNYYKQELLKRAEQLGFKREDIEKIEKPIVVRKLISPVSEKRLVELGVLSNQDKQLAQRDYEIAQAKSKLITQQTFNKIANLFEEAMKQVNLNDEAPTINEYLDMIGADIVKELVSAGVIQQNELPLFYDQEKKRIDSSQKQKIKNILMHRLFNEYGEHFESLDGNMQSGILDSLPMLMKIKDTEKDITMPVAKAMRLLAKYNAVKEKFRGNTQLYLEQEEKNMLEPLQADAKTLAIFQTLADKKPKEIRNLFANYLLLTEGDIFTPPKEPDEAFFEVFKTDFPQGIGLRKSFFARLLNAIKNPLAA